eukprot:TRINITY_DN67062_c0_g1_i1.p1 TRINITY_DN67062_c0_g1~~TRINITY_DN67062_c0_g1_i1.p1  ORF type:complete len:417 (+),score=64.94 TRINITY_DN67062_c0_g1_i1:46-1296(+)
MGVSSSSSHGVPRPMRCRSESQVPKCFRSVTCPYPQGQTAHGTYGVINYTLVGPEGGEVVVCFHGLNGSRVLFQDTANYMARNGGFRVLSFDMYGHGLSNAPPVDLCPTRSCSASCRASCCSWSGTRGRYDLDFFVDQTDELLSLIGLGDEPVNLVGFSLGGTVAVAFAKRFPNRVRRIVAMSPSGFIPRVPPAYYLLRAVWCCLVPLAPHILCTCWYKKERFAKSLRKEGQEMDDSSVHNMWSRFVWQLFVKRGVASATLAICTRVNWFDLSNLYTEVGRHQRPVLLVWGERDNLNPLASVGEKVKGFFSNAKLLVVPRAGHIAICDRPAEVVPRIMAFLKLPADTNVTALAMESLSPPAPPPQPAGEDPEVGMEANDDGELRTGPSVDQMPVPLVLGHAEDLDDDKLLPRSTSL